MSGIDDCPDCPKCEGIDITTRYLPSGSTEPMNIPPQGIAAVPRTIEREALSHRCNRCGYGWITPTADDADETKP